MAHGAFTLEMLDGIGDIRKACLRGAKVRWLNPDGMTEHEGTMRHLVRDREYMTFLYAQDDVRDAFVRITATTGTDHVIPLVSFAEWSQTGYVAFDS